MNCHAFLTRVSLTYHPAHAISSVRAFGLLHAPCGSLFPCLVALFFCQFPASQLSLSFFILISFIFALLLPAQWSR